MTFQNDVTNLANDDIYSAIDITYMAIDVMDTANIYFLFLVISLIWPLKIGKISDIIGEISDMSGRISDISGQISDINGQISGINGHINDIVGKKIKLNVISLIWPISIGHISDILK